MGEALIRSAEDLETAEARVLRRVEVSTVFGAGNDVTSVGVLYGGLLAVDFENSDRTNTSILNCREESGYDSYVGDGANIRTTLHLRMKVITRLREGKSDDSCSQAALRG